MCRLLCAAKAKPRGCWPRALLKVTNRDPVWPKLIEGPGAGDAWTGFSSSEHLKELQDLWVGLEVGPGEVAWAIQEALQIAPSFICVHAGRYPQGSARRRA